MPEVRRRDSVCLHARIGEIGGGGVADAGRFGARRSLSLLARTQCEGYSITLMGDEISVFEVDVPGARVPPHPGDAAWPVEPCTRCGSLSALRPFHGQAVCESCRARVDPFADPDTRVGALARALGYLVRRVGVKAALVAFVAMLPELALTYARVELSVPATFFGYACVGVFAQGLALTLMQDAIVGDEPVRFGPAFRKAARSWGAMFAGRCVSGIVLLVAAVFLVVPAIYLGVAFTLVMPLVLHEGFAAGEALRVSYRRMRGAMLSTFGVYCLLILPILFGFIIVGGVAGGVTEQLVDAPTADWVGAVLAVPLQAVVELVFWLVSATLYGKRPRTVEELV